MDDWVLLGYCAVDSGQLIITDPGYLEMWTENKMGEAGVGNYSWAGACATTLADGHGENERSGQLVFPTTSGDGVGVVLRTGLGDGYYPVWATITDSPIWGKRISKIEIVFIDEDEDGEE